jgi:cell division protein FtsZ
VTIDGRTRHPVQRHRRPRPDLYEINQAAAIIRETAHPDVNLIFGAVIDETMTDEIRITVIATGFEHGAPMMRQMSRAESRLPQREPVRQTVSRPTAPPVTVPVREERVERVERPSFQVSDIDIPAFLRKKKE